MTSSIPAVQSSQNAITTSLGVRSSAANAASSQSSAGSFRAAAAAEDSVQLSSSALQYLQNSQAASAQTQGQVAQLVRDASEGYTGALSLLTIV